MTFAEEALTLTSPNRLEIPRSSAPRVSVIIIAAAGSAFLLSCLRALARHAPINIPFETIIVLNNANQGLASEVIDQCTGITIITTRANLGLPGAANYARTITSGELLILLHDDAAIEAGWMEALVAAADRHADAGAIGGKVLNPDGTLQSAGMILWNDAITSAPWSGPAPPPTAFDEPRAVDYCGTSSLLIRRSTWDALGGLDEQFFPAYYVDVDLAMGVRSLGQFVLYEPASRTRHHRGASTVMRFREFISAQNRVRFRAKWSTALAAQDPPNPTSEHAIISAIRRCEEVRIKRPCISPDKPTVADVAESAMSREIRHLLMERCLLRNYSKALEEAIDATPRAREANRPLPKEPTLRRFLDRHILWRFRSPS